MTTNFIQVMHTAEGCMLKIEMGADGVYFTMVSQDGEPFGITATLELNEAKLLETALAFATQAQPHLYPKERTSPSLHDLLQQGMGGLVLTQTQTRTEETTVETDSIGGQYL